MAVERMPALTSPSPPLGAERAGVRWGFYEISSVRARYPHLTRRALKKGLRPLFLA